jgi:excinuclease ABC subunit B
MSRKTVLVEHGFRLPSALDNRPLNFPEFQSMQGQTIYVSATPQAQELEWSRQSAVELGSVGLLPGSKDASRHAGPEPGAPATGSALPGVAELVVRPTGLIDPVITLKPLKGQIDDLINEARKRVEQKERVLVTTLTKRTAEELTDYLRDIGISVRYLHSEIDAIERVEILRALRKGEFDVLVGINLLREGLDLPEVSLVAILDADKEGYLRSTTSLIQTAGRAARHLNGEVILYADVKTQSIQKFLAVSQYRREKQLAYNKEHNITPRSVSRAVEESLSTREDQAAKASAVLNEAGGNLDVTETIRQLEEEMLSAANNLEFEKAALLRDQIRELKRMTGETAPSSKGDSVSYGKPRGRRGRAGFRR